MEYLTLCHHPPQRLRDEDEVDKMLNIRAKIQLFGHKHRRKITNSNERGLIPDIIPIPSENIDGKCLESFKILKECPNYYEDSINSESNHTNEERLIMWCSMFQAAKIIVRSSILEENPDIVENELRVKI